MKIYFSAILVLTLLLLPISVTASGGHGDAHSKTHHEATQPSAHDGHVAAGGEEQHGMSADGLMAIVGSQSSKGVKGMAHIKDVSAAMAELGMKTTHHFMMTFVDEESGNQIEQGTVALKITNPDAKVGEAIELVGMNGHFGADVILDMEGEYHFRLGTQLADGTKRKYHFHYVNK